MEEQEYINHLANLIHDEFGVKLSKQSQKADWGRRPLPEKMLRYAFNDVRFILPMARGFIRRLEQTARMPWFTESCEMARVSVETRAAAPWMPMSPLAGPVIVVSSRPAPMMARSSVMNTVSSMVCDSYSTLDSTANTAGWAWTSPVP